MHADTTTPDAEREQRLDDVVAAYLRAAAAGHPPDRAALLARHPDLAADLARFFANQDAVARLAAPLRRFAGSTPALGDYQVLEEIGRGGMGVVFKARDLGLDRTVAIKLISPAICAGPQALARFRTEAQAAARLQHPNVVQVFEVGERDRLPFLVLEYVEGGSLAQRLNGTPVAADAAARLIEALARAVQAAHSAGIIHRDLKPANVLLAPAWDDKVTRWQGERRSQRPVTLSPCHLVTLSSPRGAPARRPRAQAH